MSEQTGTGRTKVVAGQFTARTVAEDVERNINAHLADKDYALIDGIELPDWAKGARVEKVQDEEGQGDNWVVVATEDAR